MMNENLLSKDNNEVVVENESNILDSEPAYSKQAYEDGYDFSSMSQEEQELSKKLYGSQKHMSDMYDILCLYDNLSTSTDDALFLLDEGWTFPESGTYCGCVAGYEKSRKKGSNEYILHLIVGPQSIRYLKFSKRYSDPIMIAIRERWKVKINPHKPFELNKIVGKLLRVKIENVITSNDRTFSKVKAAKFLSEASERCIDNMINLMIEQSEE